jgi:dTDP-4-amino-4,6-dideoxygalactose transaminase
MNVPFLDLQRNYNTIKKDVNNSIQSVLNKNNYILGDELNIFEKNFASYLGVKHFIGVGNGTDALEIAINSLGLKETDEIIVQSNTYVATCLGVVSNNCKLVLCKCDRDNFQINIEDMKNKITSNTCAIIVVHLYGLVPNMDKIVEICIEKNLILIEDAAQAHGAKWRDKRIGSFGKLSCFSFYPGKNLGAYGDGGGIATNDDELNLKIRKLRNNGSIIKYKHELVGRNSRLDTIQAAILDVKLKYLDSKNQKRRDIAKKYKSLLKDVEEIELPIELEHTESVYHLFVIKTKHRDELQEYLKKYNISTLIHYPINCTELECFKKLNFTNLDNNLSNEILSLPMFPELTDKEIEYTCKIVNQMFEERRKKIIQFKSNHTNGKDGILHCINELNFETKRVFYIDKFKTGETRGNHANINADEYLFVLNGNLRIKIINKRNEKKTFNLIKDEGILIERNNWIIFSSINEDTIVMVLANKEYNETKSISSFDDFFLK